MGVGRESIVSSLSGRAVLDQSRSSRVRKAAEVRRGPRSVTGTMTERSGEGGARRVRAGAQNGNFGAPVSRALRRFVRSAFGVNAGRHYLVTASSCCQGCNRWHFPFPWCWHRDGTPPFHQPRSHLMWLLTLTTYQVWKIVSDRQNHRSPWRPVSRACVPRYASLGSKMQPVSRSFPSR